LTTTLSIIIPVYNEQEALRQRLQRLQALPCDECLFVDGGSSDGSGEFLQQAGVAWLRSGKGRAVQMNHGATHSTGDLLLFLHIDTDISAAAITAMRQAMEDEGVCGGRFDVRFDDLRWPFRMIATMMNLRSRISRISTGDQALFVRRTVFEPMGGFPEQPLMEDIAFSRQLKQQGSIACLRHTVTTSARRWQHHGIARTILLMWKLRWWYWRGVDVHTLARMYRDAR